MLFIARVLTSVDMYVTEIDIAQKSAHH